MNAIIQCLERWVRQVGVQVETGREATAEMVRDFAPDAVVLATGSNSVRPGLPGIEGIPEAVHEGFEVGVEI